jgi:ParB/RepB/Spo0J family partition protein
MSSKGKAEIVKKNQSLERLEIVYAPLTAIAPNSYNPNRQSDADFELLLRSITEDGFTQPIVAVRTEDPELAKKHPYTIVDGEHRWRAASQLGMTEVPLAVVPMTLAQARIATLRHNRARGSEDIELATEVLRDLEKLGALDWAQDSLQLSDDELNRLLEDIPAPEALAAAVFTEAWEPQKAQFNTSGEISAVTGGTQQDALTPAAIQAHREQERRIVEARTDEEKEQIQKERLIYRLNLTFTNEEAKVVKAALGDQPAVRLLELCEQSMK